MAGQTALVVAVPSAEPVVARLRASYDVAAAYGVPAHVTVLYPFLPTTPWTTPCAPTWRGSRRPCRPPT